MKHFFLSPDYQKLKPNPKFKNTNSLKNLLAQKYQTSQSQVELFYNGRSALASAIKISVPKNSKVLTSAFTCYAVVDAIKKADCVPIFADINSEDFHFGLPQLKSALSKHKDIKAIIIQNTFGLPVDIQTIKAFADKNNLIIIEDLAHSANRLYQTKAEIGTVGDLTILSFGKNKAIDNVSGGALIIRADNLKMFYRHPKNPSLFIQFRDRIYPFLQKIQRFLQTKSSPTKKITPYKLFTGLVLKLKLLEKSADSKLDTSLTMPNWQARKLFSKISHAKTTTKPLRIPLLVKNQSAALNLLQENGYHFQDFWYEKPVSPKRYYHKVNLEEQKFPEAVKISKHIINLPGCLSDQELSKIKTLLKDQIML